MLGSSSSEVFDYIFGDSPRYYSYWASGWSCRGLRRPKVLQYVEALTEPHRRNDIIFLNTGNADTIFNLAHKLAKGELVDIDAFCHEAAEGMLGMRRRLLRLGFERVFPVFFLPAPELPARYYSRHFDQASVPAQLQGAMIDRIAELVTMKALTINTLDKFRSPGGLQLDSRFECSTNNHHACYIKTQEPIWESIQHIEGMPPRRRAWLTKLHPHEPFSLAKRMENWDLEPRPIADSDP